MGDGFFVVSSTRKKIYKHAIQVLDVDINRIKKLYIQQYSKSQSSSFRAQQGLLDKSFRKSEEK